MAMSWSRGQDVLLEVPTYAELGYKDINDPSWFGLVAPKSTPAEQIARVQKTVAFALKDNMVKQRMAAQDLYPTGTGSADFTQQIESEITKMKQVAAYAKIKLD